MYILHLLSTYCLFKKPAKQKRHNDIQIIECHYVFFSFLIPLAVIAVATCEKELTWEVETEVTIPLAVIAVATADLENPCPARLSKPDLANQMNF